ncbi:hypothetical protein MMC26_006395 [Xylographa opegraphella]|nr:hypothetical protein [Xylographa opegraphella]
MADQQSHNSAKRRRLSSLQNEQTGSAALFLELPPRIRVDDQRFRKDKDSSEVHKDTGITISSTSKLAGQTVAPFLAQHIPEQYAPLGGQRSRKGASTADSNSKFCYRHRPDLKCRRQADEPSMDQLQHELETLSQSDQQGIAHVWTLFSAAPSKHRQLMLQGILTQCCFPQLSYLSAHVRELIRIDFLSALPTELAFKILCYLDTTSLCKAAQVSQRWRTLADDDVVWHRMCEQHIDRKCTKCGWGLPLLERKRLRASKRQIQLRATGKGLNEWSPDITPFPESNVGEASQRAPLYKKCSFQLEAIAGSLRASSTPGELHPGALEARSRSTELEDSYFRPRVRPWKDVYKDRFKVGSNWKHGRYSIKTFKGHSNGVMCLQFDDHILATGSYDATIKIWDLDTGKEIRTLSGHASGIRCLQFDDNKLISGSIDKSLKVWNWRTGECHSTYTGHSGGVITLHFDSTILASGSTDKTIRIWNFEDKSTCVLRGHDDWVNAVKVDSASRTVFSASDDCTVRLWDLDKKSTIKVFKGHVGQVQQVLPLPVEFDYDETDSEPDSDEHDDLSSVASDHQGVVTPPSSVGGTSAAGATSAGHAPPPRYMLTGALDSTVRLWNVSTGRCVRTFFGHVEGVWALAADTLRVVSGAEDRTVKVWDSRSGRCERTFTGHAGPVTCIGLSDSRMCTGSEDCEARMYSFKSELALSVDGAGEK